MRRRLLCLALLLVAVLCARPASAQPRRVTITVPPGVGFVVSNIAVSSPGSPSAFLISFTNSSSLKKNDSFNISVKADTATFTGPPGTTGPIPASAVSWTAATTSGVAAGGTLSSASYSQVYASPNDPLSGDVTLHWTLGPLTAAGLRAGTHTLTVRWRLEFL